MQRIRPSWTVIAFSSFAHERNKNPRWRRPGVKNIEHLGAYFLSRLWDSKRTTSQHHRKTNSLKIATIDDIIMHRIWPFWLILYHCICVSCDFIWKYCIMISPLSILICIYWCHLQTCMIFLMQGQVTSTIRFSQGTRSANVMSICFETVWQVHALLFRCQCI